MCPQKLNPQNGRDWPYVKNKPRKNFLLYSSILFLELIYISQSWHNVLSSMCIYPPPRAHSDCGESCWSVGECGSGEKEGGMVSKGYCSTPTTRGDLSEVFYWGAEDPCMCRHLCQLLPALFMDTTLPETVWGEWDNCSEESKDCHTTNWWAVGTGAITMLWIINTYMYM